MYIRKSQTPSRANDIRDVTRDRRLNSTPPPAVHIPGLRKRENRIVLITQ